MRRTPSPSTGVDEYGEQQEEELDPMWKLLGVWGRVLLVFGCIGHVLYFGALLVGWPFRKFLTHILGLGLLLLFSRPKYNPRLSLMVESGYSSQGLQELRRMVESKLGLPSSSTSAYPYQSAPTTIQRNLFASLGWLGDVFAWALQR